MKQSTRRILETFPAFKGKLDVFRDASEKEKALEGLNGVESTFLRLGCFFENPEKQSFDIGLMYKELDEEWLELALECTAIFFKEDTYLIKKPNLSFVRRGSKSYFSQKQFADYLNENGLKYDKRKLNVYLSRGKLPEADLDLAGTLYWSLASVEDFCKQEKIRLQAD